ncbi:MAG TPA: hypothetical protein VHZ95_06055, partial [Polyangiales bacterium]|nr:hypothetical protein [Polyangiales bacterium]
AANATSLTFLDLDDFSDDPQDQLELLALSQPIVSAIPLLKGPAQDVSEIVFLQQQGVTLLSLNERTLTPISTSGSLSGALYDDAHQRLLVGPIGQPWVGTLDLTSGKTDEILLDANIQALVPMFVANRLAVLHQSDVGYITLLDLDAPSRDNAVSVRGFFVSGSLDRSP